MITYLGFVTDSDGLHKSDEKMKSIREMPNPRDKTQMRVVCGLINCYERFLRNVAPSYKLLSEDKFVWSK